MKERFIVTTEDGSNTIYIPELNENYNSIHGSIQESSLIYLEYGLNYCSKEEINILEIGFGTGLNVFNTLLNTDKKIMYHSIELYPLTPEEYRKLNIPNFFDDNKSNLFIDIHECEWDKINLITDNFSLYKIHEDLLKVNLVYKYDVVYFDAFAPDIQPSLWTKEVFSKIYKSMNIGGVLTTYCVKGDVKRALKECGFKIEKLKGPKGKREILRAVKESE